MVLRRRTLPEDDLLLLLLSKLLLILGTPCNSFREHISVNTNLSSKAAVRERTGFDDDDKLVVVVVVVVVVQRRYVRVVVR
jgi:hypothetical protein